MLPPELNPWGVVLLITLKLFLHRMNRAAQRVCEGDAKDKCHAQNLDDRMYQLRNSSSRIGFYPGIENVDNT